MIILILAGLIEAADVQCVGGFTTMAARGATVVESPSGDLRLRISEVDDDEWWQVTVHLDGGTETQKGMVWIRRSEEQTGLKGPRLYTPVVDEPLVIAEGRGPVADIPLQLRLSGMDLDDLAMWMSMLTWNIESQAPAWQPDGTEGTSNPASVAEPSVEPMSSR